MAGKGRERGEKEWREKMEGYREIGNEGKRSKEGKEEVMEWEEEKAGMERKDGGYRILGKGGKGRAKRRKKGQKKRWNKEVRIQEKGERMGVIGTVRKGDRVTWVLGWEVNGAVDWESRNYFYSIMSDSRA